MHWRGGSLIALIAIAVGCSSGSDDAAPSATVATATVSASTGSRPADVPSALDFSAPLVGGGELDLRELAGRDVAMWFWAPF